MKPKQICFRAEAFAFIDRKSRSERFRVAAEPDGSFPLQKAAATLAMHCLFVQKGWADFEVMMIPQGLPLADFRKQLDELLAVGRSLEAGIKLTRREHQVLPLIVEGLSNKQIASTLFISDRTVKFHVSALLQKYGVSDRVLLIRFITSFGEMPVSGVVTVPAVPSTE